MTTIRKFTKKGKIKQARWGGEAVTSFADYMKAACTPAPPKGGIFRKHLFNEKGICRRCDRHLVKR
jgi:hypothetical protein